MEEANASGLMFKLDLSKPLWEQVLHQIRGAVARNDLQPGEKIPSLRDLAQQLKINPNTVMRAYQELERDGLTETRRGQGTFITASQQKIAEARDLLAQEAVREFVSSMKALGIDRPAACTLLEEAKWS
ncbi:MAG: GntR family transcriptional regulator [Thermacetogeniaceae bacterium]